MHFLREINTRTLKFLEFGFCIIRSEEEFVLLNGIFLLVIRREFI